MAIARSALVAAACLLGASILVSAVQHGDERHAKAEGFFVALTNGNCTADYATGTTSCGDGPRPTMDFVDPASMEVVASVPITPEFGPVVWSDAVYMESCDEEGQGGHRGYILANERGSRIVVVDAAKAIAGEEEDAIITTLPMGSRPVHSYGIPHIDGMGKGVGEYWSHSDGDGHFDVVKVGEWDDLHVPKVTAHVEAPGHGKLLWDSDLWPFGYATNTKEPYLYEIDMENYNMTRHIKFTSHGENPLAHCKGTHGIAYSKGNGHIYATCSGNKTEGGENGLVEINREGDELVLVKKHELARGGQVYESSDGAWIVSIDKANDEVVFLEANQPGEASSVVHVVSASPDHCALDDQENCGGKPGKVAFHDMPDGSTNFFFSFTSPNDKLGNDGLGFINSKDLGTKDTLTNVKGGSGSGKYRAIRAGGGRVATIMAYPHDGLMIVNGETGDLEGTAKTNMGTSSVIYVPAAPTGFYCSDA